MAKKEKVDLTDHLRQTIMVHLALSDIQEREDNAGNVIAHSLIRDYHIKTFKDKAGLSPQAWAGTLLEEIGPGVFMLGQGPIDQHGGTFTVDNLQRFLEQAAEAGSDRHRDMAHFLGALLDDHVACQTMMEAPFSESFQFLHAISTGLDGNKLNLLTSPVTAELGAQWWIRGSYRQLFKTLETQATQAPQSVIPTPEDMQKMFARLMVDPMAMDKQLAHDLLNTPGARLGMTKIYTQLFGSIFTGIDPLQEAQVEHARIYDNPMEPEWVKFITQGEPLSSKASMPETHTTTGFLDSVRSWFSSGPTITTEIPQAANEPTRPFSPLSSNQFSFFRGFSDEFSSTAFASQSFAPSMARPTVTPGVASAELGGGAVSSFFSNISPANQMVNGPGATSEGQQGGYNNTIPGTDIPLWGPNRYSTWGDFCP